MPSNNRIRTLQFLVSPVRSGAEEVALELVRGLDPQRFRNYLVCPASLLDAFGRDWQAGDAQALALTLEGPLHWNAARRFMAYLRAEKIDVVHAHMIRAAASAVPLARLAGVPVVVHTCHGREAWRTKWFSRQYWYDRRITAWSDATIAVSESTRRYLLKEKKLETGKVLVIRNGRQLNGFSPNASRREMLRCELGIGAGDPIVGVFGRLEEQKGHRYLIEALPKVLEKVPALHVVFAGDGSLRPGLENSVRSLGLGRSVHFLGYRQDWMNWMDATDIVALPSLYEGMPLVPIEAGAMGKPVLATAVDGTCEVVVDGRTGVLVPPAQPEALADALINLLRDAEKQRAMGEAGARRARDLFSLEQQVRETALLYERLLEERQPQRARRDFARA
ncbi:MAG TPA: glycosyltransferase family 4 protein [Candidatus Acidoferrales bacterium]|nr:glycosyltransferase family 4 protein [Candidatus Acidoferrales bacterium]